MHITIKGKFTIGGLGILQNVSQPLEYFECQIHTLYPLEKLQIKSFKEISKNPLTRDDYKYLEGLLVCSLGHVNEEGDKKIHEILPKIIDLKRMTK